MNHPLLKQMSAPNGFEFTGDIRCPLKGEYFIWHDSVFLCNEHAEQAWLRAKSLPILKEIEKERIMVFVDGYADKSQEIFIDCAVKSKIGIGTRLTYSAIVDGYSVLKQQEVIGTTLYKNGLVAYHLAEIGYSN